MDYRQKPASPQQLEHYGVKGMRWGVKRDNPSRITKAVRGPYKAKRVPRDQLTLMQRQTAKQLMKSTSLGRSKRQKRKGEKAARAMVRRHGGMQLGQAWYPDKELLDKIQARSD